MITPTATMTPQHPMNIQKQCNRIRRKTSRSIFVKSAMLLLILSACHWNPSLAASADSNNSPLDEKSLAMAQTLVAKIKEKNDRPSSWNKLVSVMEHSFGLNADGNDRFGKDFFAVREEQVHNDSRRRALYWLANEDDTSSFALNVRDGLLQRYALATIYYATGGDNWSRCSAKQSLADNSNSNPSTCESDKERYLSPENHLKWDGLNGKNGVLTWLDLSSRNLVSDHFLPLELALFSQSLELLWISENPKLSGTIPDYIGDFQSVVSLSAYKTKMSGTIPDSLYTMEGLNSLRLYKSRFSGTISDDIDDLTELKWLWIHENEFTGLLPKEIGNLDNLEGLTLHGNKFTPQMKSRVKGNVIPEVVCELKEYKLTHLWDDCADDAVELSGAQGTKEDSKYTVKEDVQACLCCTRCFPRKSEKVATVE